MAKIKSLYQEEKPISSAKGQKKKKTTNSTHNCPRIKIGTDQRRWYQESKKNTKIGREKKNFKKWKK